MLSVLISDCPSPPNCIRLINALYCSPEISLACEFWLRRGTMVTPECPPTTVICTSLGSTFFNSPTNREARTTSSVVTPNTLYCDELSPCIGVEFDIYFFSSNTPFCLSTSAKMGTVELTGLEMMQIMAFGQCSAQAEARSRTIDAFVFCLEQKDRSPSVCRTY